MKLVNFTIHNKRDLKIELIAPIEDVKDWIGTGDFNERFHNLIEHQLCNGWDLVRPEEIGALTDAPIIGEVVRDDDGKITDGVFYWFPNYMVTDPVEEILTKGFVIFNRVGHD